MMQKPSLGRVVHYVETRPDQLGIEKAALVTSNGVLFGSETDVDLHVFQPYSTIKHDGPAFEPVTAVGVVPYSEEKKPGTWHWPEKF